MLNESTVRSFLVLAREGSYTRTAQLLYLSQQAVSKQMAKMESDLGCALFRRVEGKLTLTEEGRVFYDAFSRMDAILSEARQTVSQMSESTLVLGVLDAMILPPAVRALNRRFRQLCPEVQISFKNNTSGLVEWLYTGKVDAAFSLAHDCAGKPGIETIPVQTVREILAVCADHPLATEDAGYMDFRGERLFYTPHPGMELEEQSKKILPPGFSPDKMVPMNDFMASSVAAEQMQGVMILHEGTRLDGNRNFRFYPTGRTNAVVLAYLSDTKKRCALRYIREAKRDFAAQGEH